jgi:hypothetical protein
MHEDEKPKPPSLIELDDDEPDGPALCLPLGGRLTPREAAT